MIRLLFIGPRADAWAREVKRAAPGTQMEAVRLPAAAVRAFERTPPDALIYCWSPETSGLEAVAEAIRARPLGSLVPSIVIGADLDQATATLDPDVSPDAIIEVIGELLGVASDELRTEMMTPRESFNAQKMAAAAPTASAPTDQPADAAAIENKLQQIRHASYFVILEVEPDATVQRLREAYDIVGRRFADARISPELGRRFADELREIRDGLEDAYAVLSDERLREEFVR